MGRDVFKTNPDTWWDPASVRLRERGLFPVVGITIRPAQL